MLRFASAHRPVVAAPAVSFASSTTLIELVFVDPFLAPFPSPFGCNLPIFFWLCETFWAWFVALRLPFEAFVFPFCISFCSACASSFGCVISSRSPVCLSILHWARWPGGLECACFHGSWPRGGRMTTRQWTRKMFPALCFQRFLDFSGKGLLNSSLFAALRGFRISFQKRCALEVESN